MKQRFIIFLIFIIGSLTNSLYANIPIEAKLILTNYTNAGYVYTESCEYHPNHIKVIHHNKLAFSIYNCAFLINKNKSALYSEDYFSTTQTLAKNNTVYFSVNHKRPFGEHLLALSYQ